MSLSDCIETKHVLGNWSYQDLAARHFEIKCVYSIKFNRII